MRVQPEQGHWHNPDSVRGDVGCILCIYLYTYIHIYIYTYIHIRIDRIDIDVDVRFDFQLRKRHGVRVVHLCHAAFNGGIFQLQNSKEKPAEKVPFMMRWVFMDEVMDDLYAKWCNAPEDHWLKAYLQSLSGLSFGDWYPLWSCVVSLFWRTPIYKETYHVCQHAQRSQWQSS